MKRRLLRIGLLLLTVAIGLLVLVYNSAVSGPAFYRDARSTPESDLRNAGEELEYQLLNAHNSAVRSETWQLEVTDEQMNGWITHQLVSKYRKSTGQAIQPRVHFGKNEIRLGFQMKSDWFPAIVCIHLTPLMTADQNQVGIKISKAYTGWIPLSKTRVVRNLTDVAERADLGMVWSADQGLPVGFLSTQFDLPEAVGRSLRITALEVSDGKLLVSGTAEDSN